MSQQSRRSTNIEVSKERKTLMELTQQSYSGPIPPASEIAKYEDVLPGAADRIMRMAEMQLEHRTKIEKLVLEGNVKAQIIGVYCGFGVGVISLLGGIVTILMGHDVSGVIFGGTGLASLVGVFIYGTNVQSQEREEKKKQLSKKTNE